ncbi:MAG: hypothetical protein A2900_02600 [Candidatus Chisholmbacteria bacterium RIFCSPLOWO2_01_FULL_50_28]|uniref:Sortase n=1 Tax=Candidatus Chisholmbacteria bacterium RIFCSPHIGHO2_01_FULL_52_32 TaxID=1797591 RepID=A0A1G1VTF1_9BACT|nr:MAG: hypothetical protein A2786_04145 [Candidatus Chisholmbacteria bacterium RIFCSPHIGHO2_01_FULL_52_32]OGY19968.1 MAG: hypothetical protein A2900_02600 [Candidatus Chisholmbacteria bacterium RIFCSPLOWO2_01_FULL_50_28]
MRLSGTLFKQAPSRLSLIVTTAGLFLWFVALILVTIPFWPQVWYRLRPQTSQQLAGVLVEGAGISANSVASESATEKTRTLPPFDPSLPRENGVTIIKIGVSTQIREGKDPYAVLREGVWRVPEFGTPEFAKRPMILAAHRFGYLDWSQQFRVRNSFFNLPKLKQGDSVEVIWNQRKYTYEIAGSYEGEQITDYSPDLILYTCKLFNSPVRIFYYANLREA